MTHPLERLLEEATPGPWMGGSYYDETRTGMLGFEVMDGSADYTIATKINEPNAALIALAPTLARLCLEQHEALQGLRDAAIDNDLPAWFIQAMDTVLASFREVEW